jgi:hypothetical protein
MVERQHAKHRATSRKGVVGIMLVGETTGVGDIRESVRRQDHSTAIRKVAARRSKPPRRD